MTTKTIDDRYSATFRDAFAFVLSAEGEWSNDPHDSGGKTKYGISEKAHPEVDISALTLDQAEEIYYRDYWMSIHGDDLSSRIAITVFDGAVNQGVYGTILLMQQAVGVTADGKIGPKTLTAARQANNDQITNFLALRALAYAGDKNYQRYGYGWIRRLFKCALYAERATQDKNTRPIPLLSFPRRRDKFNRIEFKQPQTGPERGEVQG
jgi:lysozyme family protein